MPKSSTRSVFEIYAHEYDLITNAVQRESYHGREVAALMNRFQPESVLDAGCATGLTSRLFARHGVAVTGLDCSQAMINQARTHQQNAGLDISFVRGWFERLPKRLHNKFDLVACLANSISGLKRVADLKAALNNFRLCLKPGGHLVIQMLNYHAIKENVLFPIKATQNGKIVYERFSERRGKRMSVYVTRADFGCQPVKYEVFRHDFDNYDRDRVASAIPMAGFKNLKLYSNLLLDKRFTKTARDLVAVAQNPTD